jgi:hypothetical protein
MAGRNKDFTFSILANKLDGGIEIHTHFRKMSGKKLTSQWADFRGVKMSGALRHQVEIPWLTLHLKWIDNGQFTINEVPGMQILRI